MAKLARFGLAFGTRASKIKREFYKNNPPDADWRASDAYRQLKGKIAETRADIIVRQRRSKTGKKQKAGRGTKKSRSVIIYPGAPFWQSLGPSMLRLVGFYVDSARRRLGDDVSVIYSVSSPSRDNVTASEPAFNRLVNSAQNESRGRIDRMGSGSCDFYKVVAVEEYYETKSGKISRGATSVNVLYIGDRSLR